MCPNGQNEYSPMCYWNSEAVSFIGYSSRAMIQLQLISKSVIIPMWFHVRFSGRVRFRGFHLLFIWFGGEWRFSKYIFHFLVVFVLVSSRIPDIFHDYYFTYVDEYLVYVHTGGQHRHSPSIRSRHIVCCVLSFARMGFFFRKFVESVWMCACARCRLFSLCVCVVLLASLWAPFSGVIVCAFGRRTGVLNLYARQIIRGLNIRGLLTR